jgi:hypothetical protein
MLGLETASLFNTLLSHELLQSKNKKHPFVARYQSVILTLFLQFDKNINDDQSALMAELRHFVNRDNISKQNRFPSRSSLVPVNKLWNFYFQNQNAGVFSFSRII